MADPLRLRVTVFGDSRYHVLDQGMFDARWGADGRLFVRGRGERYPLRCERLGGSDPGDDDWIREAEGVRPGDRFFIHYDD